VKILVVDDSQTMRKIFRNALEGMGYSPASILEATDGTDAIQMLRQRSFEIDIVLADSNMPGMDGLSLLKELHDDGSLGRVPFIMVAAEAERERVLEAMRAGARGYIVKPFTPEVLRQKILTVEKELLDRRKPTDTAVIRFTMPQVGKAGEERDVELPFMDQLPEALAARVHDSASRSAHNKGEVLIEPGDTVQSLHIVDRGEVEVLLAGSGRGADVCGRGECFGELSFLSGDPAEITARAGAELEVGSINKREFELLLAGRPDLSLYLTRLLAKRARKADAKLASEQDKGLSGRLSTIALADIIQTLHASRKTGLLRIYRGRVSGPSDRDEDRGVHGAGHGTSCEAGLPPGGAGEGEIHFVDGSIRQARTGDLRGEDAFYRLMTWAEGNFTFETGRCRVKQGISRATIALLMEGTLRQDRLRKLRA
jgi:two-component system chemotaxis response regulator CheY